MVMINSQFTSFSVRLLTICLHRWPKKMMWSIIFLTQTSKNSLKISHETIVNTSKRSAKTYLLNSCKALSKQTSDDFENNINPRGEIKDCIRIKMRGNHKFSFKRKVDYGSLILFISPAGP